MNHMPIVIWDCDGVVFDSNRAKIDAFRAMLSELGASDVDGKMRYIETHPHETRFQLFSRWFSPAEADACIQAFSDQCERMYQKLCPVPEVLAMARGFDSAVISNSCQRQLRRVFAYHQITGNFRSGVYGSPEAKRAHIERLPRSRILAFVGDGELDWQTARHFDIPFLFVPMHSAWETGIATCNACPGSTVCHTWSECRAELERLWLEK